MGKKLCLLLCLALLLAGCAAREPAADGSAAQPPASGGVTAAAAEQGGDLSAVRVESAARTLTEEEILSAYDRAVDIYSWFELSPLADSGESVAADGAVYRRVDYHGVETMDDLRTCVRSIFSEELTDYLLSGGTTVSYREIDGALYVTGSGRSRESGKGGVSIQVEQAEETAYSVSVTVELLDEDGATVSGLECWAFPYAFVNGRWVFTDFRLMY